MSKGDGRDVEASEDEVEQAGDEVALVLLSDARACQRGQSLQPTSSWKIEMNSLKSLQLRAEPMECPAIVGA